MLPILAVLAQALIQQGAAKAMAPSGGPAGQNPLAQGVGFLDALVQQPQQGQPPPQPQQPLQPLPPVQPMQLNQLVQPRRGY